ncbi:hypothetical protein GCM10008023_19660 [Sphingomonas glacialis]|uniref:Uncharacterized protein n=1 Tax=Sphingomonas glacialis TaxID=658225 RepID=A0ABQ3LHB7_9SPHN|nr:hypothetical protein [Sphingomonas glacialis]GHH16071.1 hypothetical protein GCM10008023_19660 [Sphingomonas glacialis]
MTHEFANHREAAMAILTSGAVLSRKEGQFLGGCAFDFGPLTEKQINWLSILLDRHAVRAAVPVAVPRGAVH